MNELYPEITNAGGFYKALNSEFENISSDLHVRPVDEESLFELKITCALVESKNKFSQIYLSSESKLYLPDYWKDGVCLANGSTDSINLLAKSIQEWLNSDLNISELSNEYKFIKPNEKSEYFYKNKEVQYAWNQILNDNHRIELKEFTSFAIKDKIIGNLFPYTSLNRLCLSRCTGYPYTYDTPIVVPLSNNNYEVRTADNQIIGIGNSLEAIGMVKDNLPVGIKPAIKGTSEEMKFI